MHTAVEVKEPVPIHLNAPGIELFIELLGNFLLYCYFMAKKDFSSHQADLQK